MLRREPHHRRLHANPVHRLPEPWPLQPGEHPCSAAEAAAALLEIAAAASDDAEAPLAQLGAAMDGDA